jgi:hypothetical protein
VAEAVLVLWDPASPVAYVASTDGRILERPRVPEDADVADVEA